MNRLFTIGAAIAIAFSMLSPAPARANIDTVTIKNNSDKCAWVTIYFASFYTPWEIVNRPEASKPQFLRPGQEHFFGIGHETEIKIRAEVTKNADCSGGTIGDTYDVRKDGNGKASLYLKAHLVNNGRGGYNLWFL
jgi:hypothetical protein